MRTLVLAALALCFFFFSGCGDDDVRIGGDDDDEDAAVPEPADLDCILTSSAMMTGMDADTDRLVIVQRCAFHIEPSTDPARASYALMTLEGEELEDVQMTPEDGLVGDRKPFAMSIRAFVTGADETDFEINDAEEGGTAQVTINDMPVTGTFSFEVAFLGGESGGFSVNNIAIRAAEGITIFWTGGFNGRIAARGRMLDCNPDLPDSKTPEHRYICLGEGRTCGGTLPCCTDECQDNDGRPHDSTRSLTCGAGGKCVGPSGLPAYCPSAIASSLSMGRCPGNLYCGAMSTHCCPMATPYLCEATGECFELAADARDACNGATICVKCVPPVATMPGGGGDCPCGDLGSAAVSACQPDPLAPACYCAQAYVNDCLAENADGCMSDAAAARAEASRLRMSAVEEGGSCHAP